MARSKEEMIFCSLRMYLDNPQHLKIAKVLKKIEEDKQQQKGGITKNQFIIDALEYYINHFDIATGKDKFITQEEFQNMKRELKEELPEMIRYEIIRTYNPIPMISPMMAQQMTIEKKTEPDETILDLVSNWD